MSRFVFKWFLHRAIFSWHSKALSIIYVWINIEHVRGQIIAIFLRKLWSEELLDRLHSSDFNCWLIWSLHATFACIWAGPLESEWLAVVWIVGSFKLLVEIAFLISQDDGWTRLQRVKVARRHVEILLNWVCKLFLSTLLLVVISYVLICVWVVYSSLFTLLDF